MEDLCKNKSHTYYWDIKNKIIFEEMFSTGRGIIEVSEAFKEWFEFVANVTNINQSI